LDDQLKQRLVGAVIIVAMTVIFVPLLFDESPKSVSELAGSEGNAAVAPTDEQPEQSLGSGAMAQVENEDRPDEQAGYRIIPLSDAPGSEPTQAPPKLKEEIAEGTAATPAEFVGDEGAEAVEVPTRDSPLGQAARGGAVIPPTPEKAPSKKAIARAPTTGESSHARVSAAGGRSAADGEPEKPLPGGNKAETTRGKVASEAKKPAPKKPASGKLATVGAAAPAVAESSLAAKSSMVPVPTKRDDKKGVVKPNEPAKPGRVAKADSAANKKKADAALKTTVATADPAVTESANSGNSATGAAKLPAHVSSAVARKPKSDDAPTRWIVQTMSFTTEANAKALVEKLRKNKFDAFIESVPGQTGVNYRVSVGPEMDKSRAEQARKRLKSTIGMTGAVTPRR
jgi:DedD protein